jgi:cystathionine beta-synthase
MGEAHSYALEGIGEDFIPENVQMKVIDQFLMVGDEESFHFTRKLLKEECVFTGGSAGAAVMAAIKYAEKLEKPERILILLHDHGSKYAGKIFNDQWMLEKGYKVDVNKDELDHKILEIIGQNGKLV